MSNSRSICLEDVVDQLTNASQVPAELQEIFGEEAEEHLQSMYQGLDSLKTNRHDQAALLQIRRSAHTLKGAAGAVGLESATRLSHRMEDLLDQLGNGNRVPSESQLELLLSTTDLLQEITNGQVDIASTAEQIFKTFCSYDHQVDCDPSLNSAEPENSDPAKVPSAKENSDQFHPGQACGDYAQSIEKTANGKRSERYLRVPLQQLDQLVNVIGEMIINRSTMQRNLQNLEQKIQQLQGVVQRARSTSQKLQEQIDRSPVRPQMATINKRDDVHGGHQQHLDSLEFDRYTDYHLLAQLLAESNSDTEIVTRELQQVGSDIDSSLQKQQNLNRDAQASLMQIRLVPVASIVSRLQRATRTVAAKLDKPVELVVVDDGTRLDKTILDEIVDPLQHLIRNAADHGIESVEQRRAAGKPEKSQIILEATNLGTQVTLRIRDDGRGIDATAIRQKAIERNLIDPGQELSREDTFRLLFLPGFSTASEVTDVSGRGVGMDVVRDTITRLKGTIRIDSQRGQGTTFTIQLPGSVGIAPALMVQSASQTFAIPIQSIVKMERLDLAQVGQTENGHVITVDDRQIRLRELASHLNLPVPAQPPQILTAPPILIMRVADEQIALLVERVLGGQDVVVKSLGSHLKHVPGLIGATVSGDGSIIPILDPVDLVSKSASITGLLGPKVTPTQTKPQVSTAMVIDDSISVRRVTGNLLQKAGWDVVQACDGEDAINRLETIESVPDVFLCDMEMPRMDGIEFIKRIRKQREFQHTPIVMVTSRSSDKHRNIAFSAGASEYVVKPYHDVQLLELIDRLVQEARETVIE